MCHALHDPAFFRFLTQIDAQLAAEARERRCPECAGPLRVADFPRKPRGCPASVRDEYSWRLSFTCGRCDARTTPGSVRFLGRRVYVAVMLMLVSPPTGSAAGALVLQLMHLDFHYGSRKVLTRAGEWITPLLVAFIDDRSRFLGHAQWYGAEGTEQLVHGFCQALSKVGLPRSLMSDRGSAMMSGEFTAGLTALGILHVPTLPRSPHVNGKQENLWSRVEGRLLAMLEGEANLSLDQLNLATQAWITQEYHRTIHREIGATPLERYLAGPNVGRESPGSEALRAAFRIEVKRRQRRSDGTVSLEGERFEIPSRYQHLSDLHLRYARWDLSRVDLVDPHSGAILCPVRPIDKTANAEALRRVLEPVSSTPTPQATGIAPLLKQMIAEYAATGLPPAYLRR